MLKKHLLALLFTCLLAACGQSAGNHAEQGDVPVPDSETESVTTPSDHDKQDNDSPESDDAEEEKQDSPSDSTDTDAQQTDEQQTNMPLNELQVHFIDAGQADATLFQYGDGDTAYTILYDTGDWNKNDVINYLDAQDISFIDLVVISHPHADHIGQLAGIMKAYDVGEVWMNGAESSSRTFQQAMEAILASDADYAEPSVGDNMEIGPLHIEVLHPGSLSGDLNKDSLSLRMVYGDISFVFTGDAYQADELEMIKRTDQLKSTFLQLGHHGSKTSSNPQFIRAVDPDAAIYSAGADNSYGHPHPEVISLMQAEGITVYGTDVHGTILISTDGKEYDVTTKEDGTISPESTGSATGNNQPAEKEKEKDNAETEKPDTAGDCIDINQAPEEKLQEIIHIGPVRAQDVIAQRPYDRVDDLTKVDGIGPARITDIKEEGLACTGG